jgi:radical SAM superfamily enzyme YgiQ (UPF0313 family)
MLCKALLIDTFVDYPSEYNRYGFNSGLLALASHCINLNLPVIFKYHSEMFTKQNQSIDSLEKVLDTFQPDLALISSITAGWPSAIKISKTIKLHCPTTTIAVGGIFPTIAKSNMFYKSPYFDIIIIGEGELALQEILNTFLNTGVFPCGIITSKAFAPIPKIPFSIISEYSHLFPETPFPIENSRGCSSECEFCYLRDFKKAKRIKPQEDLLDELSRLDDYHVKTIRMVDDNFDITSPLFEQLLFSLSLFDFNVIIETRLDYLSSIIIEKLRKAGISEVIYGVEHIDERILQSMKKTRTDNLRHWEKRAISVTKIMDDFGIMAHPIFMLGWPSESDTSLNIIKQLACDLGSLKSVEPFVSFATPHPGSLFQRTKLSSFTSIAKDLRKYIHILPVAIPKSLGGEALFKLIEAHNSIRIQSNMTYRNPTISIDDVTNYWNYDDELTSCYVIQPSGDMDNAIKDAP